jgi:hypothetical protein
VQQAEGLVDRVDLQRFHPLLQHGHQPLAHVGVEGVVGAAHAYPLPLQLALHLEVGLTHGDAEARASALRDTMQPSLLESTTRGRPITAGSTTASQEA